MPISNSVYMKQILGFTTDWTNSPRWLASSAGLVSFHNLLLVSLDNLLLIVFFWCIHWPIRRPFLYKYISVTSLWLKLTIKIHPKRLVYLRILQNYWRNLSLIFFLCQKNIASNVERKNTQSENNAASMEHLHSVKWVAQFFCPLPLEFLHVTPSYSRYSFRMYTTKTTRIYCWPYPFSRSPHCDNVIHKGPEISSNLLIGRDKSNKFHLKQGL